MIHGKNGYYKCRTLDGEVEKCRRVWKRGYIKWSLNGWEKVRDGSEFQRYIKRRYSEQKVEWNFDNAEEETNGFHAS